MKDKEVITLVIMTAEVAKDLTEQISKLLEIITSLASQVEKQGLMLSSIVSKVLPDD